MIHNCEEDVIKAHKYCIRNKIALGASRSCGCFRCLSIFSPEEISDWIIERNFFDADWKRDELSTARCPYCGTDSVIGDSSGFAITTEFLGEMEKYWFGLLSDATPQGGKEIRRQDLLRIAEQFAAYDVQFSDEKESFEILNPFGKDSILVESEGDTPDSSYIVCYSFFHIHLETVEQVVAYVRDILEGRRVIIEFCKDGNWSMRADLDPQELRELSYAGLAKRLGCDGTPESYRPQQLVDFADSFHVRGWAQDADFDAVLVRDEQGNVTIQRTT